MIYLEKDKIIIVDPSKCIGCGACIRNCPAEEANVTQLLPDGRQVTTVNPERCITCGECVRTCEHGARDYVDDTEAFMSYIRSNKGIVLATPSIKTAFPNTWKSILDYFKEAGCLVYDVSFGADICTWAHLRALDNAKQKGQSMKIITQPCAAIVKYIEMYKPQLLTNLVKIHSPISCAAVYIKKYLNRNEPIAVLSPCIAKKQEFVETRLVDYNVTFEKLAKYFERAGIFIESHDPHDYRYAFDDDQGQVGSIYPRPGGLRDNLWLHNLDINITTSEGVHKVYKELDDYANMTEFNRPEVFDVLSCEFGCNIGPASGNKRTMFEALSTMREIEAASKKNRKTTGILKQGEDKLFKSFDENLNLKDFMRSYMAYSQSPVPTAEQLDKVYEMMGKHTEAQRKYNCHACGYSSCEKMATAIFRGLNSPDNCMVHAKEALLARHSALSTEHEKLSEITEECKTLSNTLISEVTGIKNSISNIDSASNASNERATDVQNLLTNVIDFCQENDTLDSSSIKTLIDILNTTKEAFSALYENINSTKQNSSKVDSSIEEISKLVDKISNTLVNT